MDAMRLFDGQGRRGYLSRAQKAGLTSRRGERLMRDSKEAAAWG